MASFLLWDLHNVVKDTSDDLSHMHFMRLQMITTTTKVQSWGYSPNPPHSSTESHLTQNRGIIFSLLHREALYTTLTSDKSFDQR
jgi:hypothetical protein